MKSLGDMEERYIEERTDSIEKLLVLVIEWSFYFGRKEGDCMTEEFYRWLIKLIREDRMIKFYQSPKWRKLRQRAMKRDNYECQMCKRQGKYHKVDNVHHIKEVKHRPDLALDIDNLTCLCVDHHNEVHDRYVEGQNTINKTFNNFDSSERW